jgi:DNA topoisomerase-1
MSLAESLYTKGYISYPRTDNTYYPESLNLKDIVKKFSEAGDFMVLAKKILDTSNFKPTHGKKKTTDHPPIHPATVVLKTNLSSREWKMYELIVRRFFATLADPAKLDTVRADLDYSSEPFIARGKTIKEKGWKEYYTYSKTKIEILPELIENENVKVLNLNSDQKQTKPRPRYTPSALLKILDELNLGTKSTRPAIIQKLVDRGYITGKKSYEPSEVAFVLIDTLEKHADTVTKPEMTSNLEIEMDKIEEGNLTKEIVVNNSRKNLSEILQQLAIHNNEISGDLQGALSDQNLLGKCLKCGKDLMMIRTKRGTRFVGCRGYLDGCDVSFPLPAKGKIIKLDPLCEHCKLPMIRVISGKKRYFDMCINHKCKSKESWTKKKKN